MPNIAKQAFDFIAPQTSKYVDDSVNHFRDIWNARNLPDEEKKKKAEELMRKNQELSKQKNKASLEVVATALPVGKGLSFIGTGLARGATTGAANSNAQNPIEYGVDIAKGAVGGAVGEGVIKGAGTAMKKLASNTLNNVFKEPKRQAVAAIKKSGEQLGEKVANSKDLGKGLTESQIKENALKEMGKLEDRLQEGLSKSKAKISIAELSERLQPRIQELRDAGYMAEANAIVNRIKGWQEVHGDEIGVSVGNKIKRTIYDKVNKAYGAQAAPGTEDEKLYGRIWKELIAEKVPEVKSINQKLSDNGRVAESMIDKMVQKKSFNILDAGATTAGIGASIATGNPLPAILPLATKALQSTTGQKMLAGTADILSKVVDNPVTQRAAGIVGANVVPPIIDKIGNNIIGNNEAQASQENQAQLPDPINQSSGQPQINDHMADSIQNNPQDVNGGETVQIRNKKTNEVRTVKKSELSSYGVQQAEQQATATGFTMEQLGRAMGAAAMSGDKSAVAQMKTLYDIEKEYQKSLPENAKKGKLTAGQLKEISDIKNSIGQLDTATALIDKYRDKIGPAQGRINELNAYDTDSQTFRAGIKAIAQQIGKAMEGGVLRKEDIPKYEAMLPQLSDTEQVARNKIEQVKKLLQDQLSVKEETYNSYDTVGTNPDDINGLQFITPQ